MIQPRSTIGTPEPPATRRKLDRVNVLLAHHVGVSTRITSRYQHASQELSDAKAAAAWGVASGRSWEYSYMIGLGGTIFEQAGEYMAQHCLNFNTASGGILFLNADEVQVNDAQVAAWHWLRGEMIRLGTLSSGHEAAPHYRYRSTGCPGIRAEAPGAPWKSPTGEGRLGNLIPALLNPAKPTVPATTKENDMVRIDIDPDTPKWTSMVIGATTITHTVNGNHAAVLARAEVAQENVTKTELLGILQSLRATNASPFAPGKPAADADLHAAWEAARKRPA